MYTLILTFHIIVSVLLILVVLIQVGRGAEMGAAFGNVGQANYPQTPENMLGKLTTYLAVFFMVLSLTLSVMSSKSANSTVIDVKNLPQVNDSVTPDTKIDTSNNN